MIRIRYVGYWPTINDIPPGTYDVELVRTDVLNGELVLSLRYLGSHEPRTVSRCDSLPRLS